VDHYFSIIARGCGTWCAGRIVKEQSQAAAASLNATTNEHMAAGDA